MSVFVAWMPDDGAQAALAALQASVRTALPANAPRHSWRTPRQLHMTLRYLGDRRDAPRDRIDALLPALAGLCATTSCIAVRLDRLDYWPRVLVARPLENPALSDLFADIETAVHRCGFAAEPRPATPHITLAYVDAGMPRNSTRIDGEAARMPLRLGHVSLVENPGDGGYRELAWWPLQEPAGD